ncbi:uncharacterized protein LOC142339553 isoform X2 [Convolutriloba macropyga]
MGRLLDSLTTELKVDANEENPTAEQISPNSSCAVSTPTSVPQHTPPSVGKDSGVSEGSASPNSSIGSNHGISTFSSLGTANVLGSTTSMTSSKSSSGSKKFKIDQIAQSLACAPTATSNEDDDERNEGGLMQIDESKCDDIDISGGFPTDMSSGGNGDLEIPSFPADLSVFSQNSVDAAQIGEVKRTNSTEEGGKKQPRTRGNPNRPFKCDICGLAFTQKGNLSRHKQIHTPNKPFKCDLCPYASRRKDALINHRSTHCFEKPFKCTKCNQAYKQKSSLRDHLKSTHHLSAEEIRDIIPPDFPLPIGFEPSAIPPPPQKRKKSASPMMNNSMVDASFGESEIYETSSEGNRTPSPQNSSGRLSPEDERSQIIKKCMESNSALLQSLNASSQECSPLDLQQPMNFCKKDQDDILTSDDSMTTANANNTLNLTKSQQAEDLTLKHKIPAAKLEPLASRSPASLIERQEQLLQQALKTQTAHSIPTSQMQQPATPTNITAANYIAAAFGANGSNFLNKFGLGQNQASLAVAQQAQAYQIYMNAMKAQQDRQQQQHNLWKQYSQQVAAASNSQNPLLAQWAASLPGNPSQQSPGLTPFNSPAALLAQKEFLAQKQVLTPKTSATNVPASSPSSLKLEPESSPEKDSSTCQSPNAATNTSSLPVQCETCRANTYTCETCHIIFTDEVMFTIHMGIHTKSNPLQCNYCDFLATSKYDFAAHVARGVHKPKESTASETSTE